MSRHACVSILLGHKGKNRNTIFPLIKGHVLINFNLIHRVYKRGWCYIFRLNLIKIVPLPHVLQNSFIPSTNVVQKSHRKPGRGRSWQCAWCCWSKPGFETPRELWAQAGDPSVEEELLEDDDDRNNDTMTNLIAIRDRTICCRIIWSN